jgi:hypothetical protein
VIEFWLALAGNVQVLAFIAALGLTIGTLMIRFFLFTENCEDHFWDAWSARTFGVGVVCAVLACMPSIDDLWKTRIALIKFHLASPENVEKATDEIARIGKKLECKYLGGCEDAKPEPKP